MSDVDTQIEPLAAPRGRSVAWWGAVLFSIAASMAVATLCFTWVYLAVHADEWPPAGATIPPLSAGIVTTTLLVASVGPSILVSRAARRAGLALQGAAALTAGLGAVALAVLGTAVATMGVDPAAHAYESITMLLPIVHGLLLAGGVIGMAMVAARERTERRLSEIAEAMSAYWNAMVVVWLLVAAVLFGAPRFWEQL